jgi:hypothetical protein
VVAGIAELDAGQTVSHEKVSKWLKIWGKAGESKAPRLKAWRPIIRQKVVLWNNQPSSSSADGYPL